MNDSKFLKTIADVSKIITPIDSAIRFPEILDVLYEKYSGPIETFCQIIKASESSGDVLKSIRSKDRDSEERMALLKMYRRCVSPVLDTETTKKIQKISTDTLIETYGMTFKPIGKLKEQFEDLTPEARFALAALIGEYDTRGQSGYELTGLFFDWFEEHFKDSFTIEGPRGAGRDIELSTIYPEFKSAFPCDFVIRRTVDSEVVAIGFARYDSTRGGAQSDDRTGGNSNKVEKAKAFDKLTPTNLKMIFLSDGPGLMHGDTWKEACDLDGDWDGRVRVITLKLAPKRITPEWLNS
ncbi:hypothetical protein AKG11_31720 [Shinella sp. SUS2]|uniref:hypothetical protein n=1 Tax=unclassified Shinella TaxID=2643062 RepID=UPI00068008B5|nr:MULTISPECIES: hypothetical protein [unclassified Shinella]KNY12995.1 hypothetical protein AKG11_31720 [Shinella sp. SUS2]KOC71708.1 hypothetical protein AKG10_31520 [Shinella sp. GWS1]